MTHVEVYDAVKQQDTPRHCFRCGNLSDKTWPHVPGAQPEPYCDRCLAYVRTRLLVAVGVASYK